MTMMNLNTLENSKPFCPIPWIHSSMDSFGNLRVCCICKYKPFSMLLKEDGSHYNAHKDLIPRNHEVYKEMRVSMLNEQKHRYCKQCWEREDAKLPSNRQVVNAIYPDVYQKTLELTSDDGSINPKEFPIRYYDLRLGNKCNCKCVMCGPEDSSMWYGEVLDWTNNFDTPYLKSLIDNSEHIKKIYFTGGEPLINEPHWKLLDVLLEKSHNHITIDYNTNGTIMKEYMFDIWSQFKSVLMGFSIDGIGDVYEKIRVPAKWKTIEKNLMLFEEKSTDNMFSSFAISISIMNILNVIDLFKWYSKQNFKRIRLVPHFNIISYPSDLSIRRIPIERKEYIKQEYEKFYLWVEEKFPTEKYDIIKAFSGIINSMFQ